MRYPRSFLLVLFVSLAVAFPKNVAAQSEVVLQAPEIVDIGMEVAITVGGAHSEKDFITIVSPDTPEGKYQKAQYPRGKGQVVMFAPEEAGRYEIRMLSGASPYPTITSLPLEVRAVETVVSVEQNEIKAGAEFTITWSGPNNKKDFITWVPAGAEEGKYNQHRYVRSHERKPLRLTAPELPGEYEVRYISGQQRLTLASTNFNVLRVEASITAPESVSAGSKFPIDWSGPANNQDFVTIVEAGADEGSYNRHEYVSRAKPGAPFKIVAPEVPGEYEIRYLTGKTRLTLASAPVTVSGVEATLQAPESAVAGSEIEIKWEGPDNDKDFITIVQKGAKEGSYKRYGYVSRKKGPRKLDVVDLRVPEEPGEYEIRYLSGREYFTLASRELTVTKASASLEAPLEVVEGATFEVGWSGPDNQNDKVVLVPLGADEGASGIDTALVARKKGPSKLAIVTLTAPEEQGSFELRYVTGAEGLTLATHIFKTLPVTAALQAPEQVEARQVFEVVWEGPGNVNDYVELTRIDSADRQDRRIAYVKRGKTLKFDAPLSPGDYQLHYVTGAKEKRLATRAIAVTPSRVPGELQVVSSGNGVLVESSRSPAVALVLDASGSMLKSEAGARRIDVAKNAIKNLINGPLEEGTPFSLRVFGHKEKESCRTDLEIPLGALDRSKAASTISAVEAMNYAKTPIAASLLAVKEDLAQAEGNRVVVLVTDGEETCDGDPETAIRELVAQGFETRVNIVGFAIDEFMLKETFKSWARVGKGAYFDAVDAEQLEKSIRQAIETPYEVLNGAGELVASGTVNGDALSLLPGTYTVRVLGAETQELTDIAIVPERRNKVEIVS